MSDSNTPVEVVIDDDLDSFSETFFGQNESVEAPASATEDETPDDTSDALEPNDTPVEDDADGNKTEDDPEPETPKEEKLTPTQKRINEVVGKQRAAERERDAAIAAREALEARIAQLTAQSEQTKPAEASSEDTGPSPLDKNEDGTDKYPLGDFDPNYIRDLVKHEEEIRWNERIREEAQRSEQAAVEAEIKAIEDNWTEKLGTAKERYPDFEEVSQELIDHFEGIPQDYGEYLVRTLQSMEHGPDVLYYLAQNPDIADQIVKSGPQKATIAFGRIEARFEKEASAAPVAQPRISQAPTPPPQNKGNNAAVIEVADDTDDLDAFTAKLFKKRK